MKDNIEGQYIGNRKIIIEIRFEAIASMLDKKGTLIEAIEKAKPFNIVQWELGNEIVLRDHNEKEEATNVIVVSFNRISFISWKIDSVESFYASFKKLYDAVVSVIGMLQVKRIGCRIIGTYKIKTNKFQDIVNNFKREFPARFLVEQYPAKDFLFKLEYANGMYQIGPLSSDDAFYDREFKGSNTIKHVGIVIDTDNYLTNETQSINDKELIKDVFILSLSVEKDLYSNLANL